MASRPYLDLFIGQFRDEPDPLKKLNEALGVIPVSAVGRRSQLNEVVRVRQGKRARKGSTRLSLQGRWANSEARKQRE